MAANTHSLDLEATSTQQAQVTISATNNLAAMSIGAWIKLESASVSDAIACQIASDNSESKFMFRLDASNADELRTYIAINSAETSTYGYTTDANLSTGTWYHVAFVFNGAGADNAARLKIYVNGSPKSMSYNGTIPATLVQTAVNNEFHLGSKAAAQNFFDGLIDEVFVTSDVVTEAELTKLYNGFAASDILDNRIADWKLNNAYTDESGNAYTLSPSSGPTFSTTVPFATYASQGGNPMFFSGGITIG